MRAASGPSDPTPGAASGRAAPGAGSGPGARRQRLRDQVGGAPEGPALKSRKAGGWGLRAGRGGLVSPRLPACDLAAPPPQVKGSELLEPGGGGAPGAAGVLAGRGRGPPVPGARSSCIYFPYGETGGHGGLCVRVPSRRNSCVCVCPRVSLPAGTAVRVAGVISAGRSTLGLALWEENLDASLEMIRKGCY